jgi:hypothetical protein
MRKVVRTRAAQQVANQLIPTETALDEALSNVVRLIGTTIDARIDASLPVSCAHKAIVGMNAVASLITQARTELVEVHAELALTKTQIGLREVSFGGLGGCPPMNVETQSNVVSIAS